MEPVQPPLFRVPPPEALGELGAAPFVELLAAGRGASERRRREALQERPLSLEGAAALLANGSGPALAELLGRARAEAAAPFGREILLYAPCYLSSFCVNHCRYCGFSFTQSVPRILLSGEEMRRELGILASRGMKRVLLVAGEYPSKVTPDYIAGAIALARELAPEVDLEVGPVRGDVYAAWSAAGAAGVICYQETYDPGPYEKLHPRGPKSYYDFRLGTLERAAAGGMNRLGLGVLLGLAEPARDLLALIVHARFLQERFPACRLTVSLPRLRPAVEGFAGEFSLGDEELLRYYSVLRLALPQAGLIVSTREPAALRRRLLDAGITQMSAGSVTTPGGYTRADVEADQFRIADDRSVGEVRTELESLGYSVR